MRSWVLPEEPAPVRLMNTIWADRTGVQDGLRTPSDLRAWLASNGATVGSLRVTPDDVRVARQLRDALRRVAALYTDDTRASVASVLSALEDVDTAVARINSAVAAAPPVTRLALANGLLRRDKAPLGPPVPGTLAKVAAAAIDLFTSADGPPLRACHAPGCVLYFCKDHPRREWCSTTCGNRARAARHYRRHRLDNKTGFAP